MSMRRSGSILCSVVAVAAMAAAPAQAQDLTLGTGTGGATQLSPREIWPQAASAANAGDLDAARKKTSELLDAAKGYGIKTFPSYAASAAAIARKANKEKRTEVAAWSSKTAESLDAKSPAVAFSAAELAQEQNSWGRAVTAVIKGIGYVFANYRTNVLGRADLMIVLSLTMALAAAIFAAALFIRYGRSMGHDFREFLSRRIHGGAVSVLGFALLFLPIFLWLGPMWLIFYWFTILFGYASVRERVLIVVLSLILAVLPIAVDWAASRAAGVDSPVMVAALSSSQRSFYPDALRRMQELVTMVPENATLQLLLGNMQMFEGNEQQAAVHFRRSVELKDSAGAHVNIGNLHFLNNDFVAAMTQYQTAQKLDPRLAIAFYNDSVASGETYRFNAQGQKLDQAKKIDPSLIEKISASPPPQKIVMYSPPLDEAWKISESIARRGVAKSIFGTYAYFDAVTSMKNPVTIGSLLAIALALVFWLKRKRAGFAGSCIKCGRTFCPRCKSARESATYCTQCIHIYLKRDGVSLDTKRSKLEEVSQHHAGMSRRNKLMTTFLPGSAQMVEGRTVMGVISVIFFLFFVLLALLIGRLAPAIGPVGETAHLMIRVIAIALAAITWFVVSIPVYRRRSTA